MFDEINKLTENALNGEINALETYIFFNNIEKAIKEAKEMLLPSTVAEVDKGYIFTGYDVKVSQKTTYDYKHIGLWQEYNKHIASIEELAKTAAKLGKTIIDETTGEIVEAANINYSKPFLTIKKTK